MGGWRKRHYSNNSYARLRKPTGQLWKSPDPGERADNATVASRRRATQIASGSHRNWALKRVLVYFCKKRALDRDGTDQIVARGGAARGRKETESVGVRLSLSSTVALSSARGLARATVREVRVCQLCPAFCLLPSRERGRSQARQLRTGSSLRQTHCLRG